MCEAFSCLIDKDKNVIWKLGIDSHTKLIDISKYKDSDDSKKFVRSAHREWLKKLDKILVRKAIIHPFNDIKPPKKITKKYILLLQNWDSVRDSVGDSVWNSVRNSVWNSVGDSVWNSVRDSVWNSVGDSVGDSVWNSVRDSVGNSVGDSVWSSVWNSVWDSVYAYIGSFFKLPKWEYIKHKKNEYPYESLVILWNAGFVPSFDGKIYRLHGGKNAKILFEISKKDLKNYGKGK